MVEEFNMLFNSVFTREDDISLPVPKTKFNGHEWKSLGQFVVTPEVMASETNNSKIISHQVVDSYMWTLDKPTAPLSSPI